MPLRGPSGSDSSDDESVQPYVIKKVLKNAHTTVDPRQEKLLALSHIQRFKENEKALVLNIFQMIKARENKGFGLTVGGKTIIEGVKKKRRGCIIL